MKKVLITGGTRGIGAAMTRRFTKAGYQVVATYISRQQEAEALADETGAHTMRWDISDFENFDAHADKLLAKEGDIDIVIHNAGVTRDASLLNMTPLMWHQVIATNLSSIFYLCKAFVPGMKAAGWGRVVALSSVNAVKGQRGQTNYAASKAGLLGFVKSLAQELSKSNVTVNALAPGYTETEMVTVVKPEVLEKITQTIPLGRLIQPSEIAEAAFYLASDQSGMVTGQTLHINGGQWMG